MATQYSNKPIVTNGLVYALDFGNQKSYVSGSSSARSLLFNPVTASVSGSSLDSQNFLNLGSNNYVDTNQVYNLGYTQAYTLILTAEPKGNYGGYGTTNIVQGGGDNTQRFWSGFSNNTVGLWFLPDTSVSSVQAYIGRQFPITAGKQHLVLRYSSGSYSLFRNGILVPPNVGGGLGGLAGGGTLSIGSPSGYFAATGSFAQFQVYNRALTSDEIWSNYQLSAIRYGLGPQSSKPYSLDENAFLFLSQSGITDPIITSSINTFVLGLKSASLWDKMIAIYPFVGTGSAGVNLTGSQRWNLKEPTTAFYYTSYNGTWQGSTSGSTPSGSGTYISTGVTPISYHPNFLNNNAHISILSYDTPTSSSFLAGTGIDTETAVSTLAGDYGTPAAAYSVRKVRTAYSGALMDVRRSIDNATSSIGYVSNGDLDTGSLSTFVNAVGEFSPGNYSGLAAAYSLRKVSASYSGNAIDVRRDSDNTTGSIGFDASGNLDTGSLLNFVYTGSTTLPGTYSGLFAAYSLRKVVSTYTGSAIMVRSGSVSQSIGFDSFGNLNTASIASFAGSGDAFVSIWYDQSGNNNHASQSTSANQPKIYSGSLGSVITSSGRPALVFDGTNDTLTMSNLHGRSYLDQYFVVNTSDIEYLYPSENGGTKYGVVSVSGSTSTNLYANYGTPSIYANGTLFTGSTRDDVYNFLTGSKVVVHQSASTSTWTNYQFGDYAYGTVFFTGSLQELIVYTSSQASNRTFIENNINTYYNVYARPSGYVAQWYDQSGNNRHATQSVSTQQPLIVSSGSLITLKGKPSIYFDSVDDAMLTPTLLNRPYAVILVAQQEVGSYIQRIINSPTRNSLIAITRIQETVATAGDISSGSIGLVNTPYVVSLVNDTTSSQVYSNTVNKTTTFNNNDFGLMNFGASGVYNEPAQAFVSEVIAYTGSIQISSSRTFIENNINNYYSIYTGSNNGFVARWYDQSGNNNHATQTATGSQPLIVLSGSIVTENSRSTIQWDGNDDFLATALSVSQPDTFFIVSRMITTGSTKHFIDAVSGVNRQIASPSTGNYSSFAGTSLDSLIPVTLTSMQLSSYLFNNTTSFISVNGILTTGSVGTSNLTNMQIGKGQNTSAIDGKLSEIIVYPSNQSTNRQAIEYGINNYYNIYPQTSSFTTSSFTIKATPAGITGAINNQPLNGISSTGPVGFITVSRTGSNALTIARNGVTSSFTVPASGALSTGIYLGASNYNGITVGSSPLGISFASVGVGLNNSELRTLNNLTTKLQLDLRRVSVLDQYPGARSAYSVRKLSKNYTGSAIQVIRSSDNAIADIGFNGFDLDTTALLNFVGSGTSNHGYVRTWYDQSGFNNHVTQSTHTAGANVAIVLSGSLVTQGTKPALYMNGQNMIGTVFTASELSTYMVGNLISVSGYNGYFYNRTTTGYSFTIINDVNGQPWRSTLVRYSASVDSSWPESLHGSSYRFPGFITGRIIESWNFSGSRAASEYALSGTNITIGSAASGYAGTSGRYRVGPTSYTSNALGAVYFQEFIVYDRKQTSAIAIQDNLDQYFEVY